MVHAVVVAAVALLVALPAGAASFVVDSTADAVDALPGDGACASAANACTLRAAIMEANALPGQDSIAIPEGEYVLAIAGEGEDAGATGDLDVRDGVSITGAGAATTILDGRLLDGVLSLDLSGGAPLDATVDVSGLTITGGRGFGLRVLPLNGQAATVTDCVIRENTGVGVQGGGNGAVRFVRTGIAGNTASGLYWYGIPFIDGTLTLESSVIADNDARGLYLCEAWARVLLSGTIVERNSQGGLYVCDAILTIEDSVFRHNTGGAAITLSSDTYNEIRRTRIEDNVGTDVGGVDAASGSHGDLLLEDSTIARNVATSGVGGVRITGDWQDIPVLSNSTLALNSGSSVGGLLVAISGPSGNNLTIVENSGGVVGGLGFGDTTGSFSPSLALASSIIARNASPADSRDCGDVGSATPGIQSLGSNLIGDGTDCPFTAQPDDLVGTSAAPIDPLVGPLAENGGATETLALLAGSPALDAAGSCPATDQRGAARPYDADQDGVAACDIGAFESADFDGDGVGDLVDVCMTVADAGQEDADGDAIGDACDACPSDPTNDVDGDAVCGALDNCPGLPNGDQADADSDLVGDACDNCVAVANPRVPAEWLDANAWAVLTGGQRDDDLDGYGNACDAKFPGSPGRLVGAADLVQFRASQGKAVELDVCGTSGVLPCAIFDLHEPSPTIGAPDFATFRALIGNPPGPRCATCPLVCTAGALATCD